MVHMYGIETSLQKGRSLLLQNFLVRIHFLLLFVSIKEGIKNKSLYFYIYYISL